MKRAAICAFTLLAACAAHAADLTVEVRGVAQAKGSIMIAVYDNAAGWLKKPARSARVEAATGTVKATFAGMDAGSYAVSLYHDANGNGRLDSNELRIPIEPYGFSNGASGMFGPASFEDARFDLPAQGASIVVELKS